MPRRFPLLLALVAALTLTPNLGPKLASGANVMAVHQALGVELMSLPPGWSVIPGNAFYAGWLSFGKGPDPVDGLRMSIQPIGLLATSTGPQALTTAVNALLRRDAGTTPVQRTQMTVDGLPAIALQGMPGPPGLQIVVATNGAAYDLVLFGSDTLQPDQAQALGALRFIPRAGTLPSAEPPSGFVPTTETRPSPPPLPAGVRPAIPGMSMYVFWGGAVNHGACNPNKELGGGDLITGGPAPAGCGGNFYGQGDHTGQDYYAIDWDEAAGNSVFAQKSGGATVSFAGWRAGSFSGYGYWVVLDLGTGSDGAHYYSYYAHLQDVSVSTGNTVFVNNVIGHSGCSDSCTGPHVHSAWVKNPTLDTNGQPYNGTGVPQSPLNTYNSQYPSYNPLSQNEVIHGH